MARRRGFLILEMMAGIALFTMGILFLNSVFSAGELSESQQATIDRLGVDGRTTMVVFEAPWCGACKAYKPTLRKVKKKHRQVAIRRVNIEKDDSAFRQLGYRALPTTLIIAPDGKLLESFKGTRSVASLRQKLSGYGA